MPQGPSCVSQRRQRRVDHIDRRDPRSSRVGHPVDGAVREVLRCMRHERLSTSLRPPRLPAEVEESRSQHHSPGLTEAPERRRSSPWLRWKPARFHEPARRQGRCGPRSRRPATGAQPWHRRPPLPVAPGAVERFAHALLVVPAARTRHEADVRERFWNHSGNHSSPFPFVTRRSPQRSRELLPRGLDRCCGMHVARSYPASGTAADDGQVLLPEGIDAGRTSSHIGTRRTVSSPSLLREECRATPVRSSPSGSRRCHLRCRSASLPRRPRCAAATPPAPPLRCRRASSGRLRHGDASLRTGARMATIECEIV